MPKFNRVLVTGATGRVGRLVVNELLNAREPVRALTRRPDAAGLPASVEVVAGDLTVPDSLDDALHGIDTVFLLWTAPPATAAAVIERLASHARRVVFLSSPHRTPHPFFQQPNPMAALHAEIERLIAAAAIASTIIRPGMFASNVRFWWADMIRDTGVVRWPYGAAETAPIDERDIAAVAARVLYEDGHAGGDYVITGPESLSQAEQVRHRRGHRAPDSVSGTVARRVPSRNGRQLAPSGGGHAARRVGCRERPPGVRDVQGGRHHWIADSHVSPVGRRSR
jgi:uncharacterized protein YbjT (DUF2867 family)